MKLLFAIWSKFRLFTEFLIKLSIFVQNSYFSFQTFSDKKKFDFWLSRSLPILNVIIGWLHCYPGIFLLPHLGTG